MFSTIDIESLVSCLIENPLSLNEKWSTQNQLKPICIIIK